MLGFLKHNPVSPCQFLELISSKTSPNFFWSDDTRFENRNNRTIPVTLGLWTGKAPGLEQMSVAITKDISNNGICLISPLKITAEQIVVGMFVPETEIKEPMFFLVDVCSCRPFAAGFWQIGVKARELLNTNFPRQIKKLIPEATKLLSPAE